MSKYTTYDDYMAKLPVDRQTSIRQRSQQLEQSLKLAELRQSSKLNQKQLAELMGVSQANVSKVENGKDVHLSTLQKYVSALGGEIQITAIVKM